jgi:hypothetical protein
MRKLLIFATLAAILAGVFPVLAATNISSTAAEHHAWNDFLGWVNFYSTNSVNLTATRLQGYASTIAGDFSLDCATTSIGNICGTSNYYVSNNGVGTLAGYGWIDTYGWVSFNCSNTGGCGTSNYAVSVNPNTGVFSGYAWNDLAGWFSFNCADLALCGISDYKVVSTWRATSTSGTLDSAIIDTGVGGAQVNGVTWMGNLPADTDVRIQIATSESSTGPWNFYGPDGTSSSFYAPDPNVGAALYPWVHPPGRYFRYRVTLVSDISQTLTPRVDDVIVRWSP